MWRFEQTDWMRAAARDRVTRHEVVDPGGSVEVPDGSAVLWRYMDLAKLLALVGNRSLYFSSIEKLGDPFEGQWSHRTFDLIYGRNDLWVSEEDGCAVVRDRTTGERLDFPMAAGESAEAAIEHWRGVLLLQRPATYVNCWYREVEESEAMWRLFAGERYGVAVRTTAARLVGSFTERLPDYLGCVSYLVYDKEAMAFSELPPAFYKRKAFRHEHEVRLIAAPECRRDHFGESEREDGIEYPVDPGSLIEEIVVSPYSPAWLAGVVGATVASLGLDATVSDSTLKRQPASKSTSVTHRRLEAYFAFLNDGSAVPLRISSLSRAEAEAVARGHWGLNGADTRLEVWKKTECEAGHAEEPVEYEYVADPSIAERSARLDPELDQDRGRTG